MTTSWPLPSDAESEDVPLGGPESPRGQVPLYPAERQAPPCTVCVTGATGYLAGPIVARLLAAGHAVHATCRDPHHPPSVSALKSLPGADSRLRIFRADLLQPGSFDEAVAGCDYVIHTASPFKLRVPRDRVVEELVAPAVRGVENVFAAVNKSETVRRVVMTSSIAALCSRASDHDGRDRPLDEGCWNTSASPDFLPYSYSKTAAERRAWALCGLQKRWSLVVINPGLVFGPPVGANCGASESVALLRRLCRGIMYPAAPNIGLSYVDVRDVAAAHVLAMVTPQARGRYVVVAGVTRMRGLTRTLEALYPGGAVRSAVLVAPRWIVAVLAPVLGVGRDFIEASWGAPPRFSTAKAEAELGLRNWVPLEVSLGDMVEDLAAKGLVPHPLGAAARGGGRGGGAGEVEGSARRRRLPGLGGVLPAVGQGMWGGRGVAWAVVVLAAVVVMVVVALLVGRVRRLAGKVV